MYCEENGNDKTGLTIFICNGNYYYEITDEYWEDIMATDDDYVTLPKEIQDKLNELNEVIKNYKQPASWSPSKYLANTNWD